MIDGGREYGGNILLQWAVDNGIQLRVTAPHSSEQNGRGEVSNHSVSTKARKLMLAAQLAKK